MCESFQTLLLYFLNNSNNHHLYEYNSGCFGRLKDRRKDRTRREFQVWLPGHQLSSLWHLPAALHWTTLCHCIIASHHCTLLHIIALDHIILQRTILRCISLYCSGLYHTSLHCIELHCSGLPSVPKCVGLNCTLCEAPCKKRNCSLNKFRTIPDVMGSFKWSNKTMFNIICESRKSVKWK